MPGFRTSSHGRKLTEDCCIEEDQGHNPVCLVDVSDKYSGTTGAISINSNKYITGGNIGIFKCFQCDDKLFPITSNDREKKMK